MGVRNYLIEGVSGTGKTSVATELQRRGFRAVHGDRELAYQGDPETGAPTDGFAHEHHVWRVDAVRALAADRTDAVTFFCGGSRNFSRFIDLFDGIFVLEVDLETMLRRLERRPEDEWGGKQAERDLAVRLHRTKEDLPPDGIVVDATQPLERVVDEILRRAGAATVPEPETLLETDRLLLRPWHVSEAAIQREMWAERDPRVPAHRRIDAAGRPSIEDVERWIRQGSPSRSLELLAAERKGSGDVIGYCGLIANGDGPEDEPELAFEFLQRAWGQGYATEAARAVLDQARESGYRRLWATVRDWNTASLRVLAKVGFVESGRVDRDEAHGDSLFLTMRL